MQLAEREMGVDNLKAAANAFRAVANVHQRDKAPLEWAHIQSDLGSALLGLSEREPALSTTEAAIAAFRAALDIYTPKELPSNGRGPKTTSAFR